MNKEDKHKILLELGGFPEQVYDGLVREFFVNATTSITEGRALIQTGDYDALAKRFHSLKGAAGNLRIDEIAAHARHIELNAKHERNSQKIEELLKVLETTIKHFQTTFPFSFS